MQEFGHTLFAYLFLWRSSENLLGIKSTVWKLLSNISLKNVKTSKTNKKLKR